ncbi:hypothetical protein KEM56_000876 [Ascosphaera pollenicola]|nr:hypothetical protein KEM56_000876 [Ascosphaera pollenicola]
MASRIAGKKASSIDSYGTAKYGEVNPGLPTIVTFPFMFAVMFGDLGHGMLMTMTALALIIFEKKLARTKLDELSGMVFYGRYIVLMMGLFSMYTGALYNDIFSKSLSIWPSAWTWPQDFKEGEAVSASLKGNYRYPFGLDWAWHDTDNSLLFANSYKMKLSILLGWVHMTYSLCLSLVNSRHFKKPVEFWGNFLPGMIFFQSIFGYLVITIVYKWSVDWYGQGESPPGLLNMLIFMFLSPGTVNEQLYSGQSAVQVMLLLIALVQVPILLLLKPLYLRWEHNRARALGYRELGEPSRVSAVDEEGEDRPSVSADSRPSTSDGSRAVTTGNNDEEEHEEFDFSEVMIHQIIHTIASYPRLWALSLAHQQLSIVLWNMTLRNAFGIQNPTLRVIMLVVTFYMWFTLTICILCIMEGTSAMLHALRLHWVEAMSKHFIGDGIPFTPFSFKTILEEDPVD